MKALAKTSRILTISAALILLLSACGSKTAESALTQEEGKALTETVEAAPQATGGFDSPVITPDKISYTLSSPSHFVPGKFASGQLPDLTNEKFTVTVSVPHRFRVN